jgi:hypothetical protein
VAKSGAYVIDLATSIGASFFPCLGTRHDHLVRYCNFDPEIVEHDRRKASDTKNATATILPHSSSQTPEILIFHLYLYFIWRKSAFGDEPYSTNCTLCQPKVVSGQLQCQPHIVGNR